MTGFTIETSTHTPQRAIAPATKPSLIRRRRRKCKRPPVWKLAAGYRLMAWRSLRKGDLVDARMYAASSRALIATMND